MIEGPWAAKWKLLPNESRGCGWFRAEKGGRGG